MKVNHLTTDNWTKKEKEDALALEGPILLVGASGFVGAKMYYSLAACAIAFT